jgi:hypothetical protein
LLRELEEPALVDDEARLEVGERWIERTEAKVTVQTGLDGDMSLSIAPQERRQNQSHGERVGDTPSQSLRSSGKEQ